MALAFASQPTMGDHMDDDELMIDIDMDMEDVPPEAMAMPEVEEDDLEEGEEPTDGRTSNQTPVIAAIYTEDPSQEPQPEKVHIRGVDDMHTSDIRAFANDHFPSHEPSHIQWIDDSSANIVYSSRDVALQAMLAFTATPITAEEIHAVPLEMRPAKTLASRPMSKLEVRVATAGDRKQKGARDASRYYLFHPEHDPAERRRGGDGDYQRNRFDHRELRRRRDQDHNADAGTDFAASMYDDAPAAETKPAARGRDLFSRTSGKNGRRRSASPGRSIANSDEIDVDDSGDDGRVRNRRSTRNGYRDRNTTPPPVYARRDPNPVPRDNVGKELFAASNNGSSKSVDRPEGTLHSDKIEVFPSKAANGAGSSNRNAAAAARLKADLFASSSSAQTSPGRGAGASNHHKRSKAMDAKNAEDLSERFARKSLSIDSTKAGNVGKELFGGPRELFGDEIGGNGLNIRGSAVMDQGISIKGSGGMSIKGRATNTRELFPEQYLGNSGKELFNEPVRKRAVRARADDWH